ncbi:hypothetical protein [Kosmotoga pacifica]|uniref:N-terminal cleavage protein n=1 Tax=Kosmotoga pacifica TaxID=1330330 RepID=A0A0G2ZGY2_9BACT|nr:hypothetical protein [Kosmotoga pacifica]AKI98013.1 hypothetical protein IX53_09455 [Kosmotoga pacifica]
MRWKSNGAILIEALITFLASGVIAISLFNVLINYLQLESRFYRTIRYTNAINRAFDFVDNDLSRIKKLKSFSNSSISLQIKKGKKNENITYYFEGKLLKRRAKADGKRFGVNTVVELKSGGYFDYVDGVLTITMDEFSLIYNLKE